MKKHILMAMTLVMATTAASAQLTAREKWDKLSGNRFDFLNAAGERVASRYSNYYDTSSVWFQTSFNKPEDGFTVVDGYGNPFSSIEVVPYGVNSYPLELSTEESEISYTYRILPEWTDTNGDGKVDYDDIDFSQFQIPAPDKATTRAGESNDIKCGELILFTFDIPDGTYPVVSFNQCYSQVFAGEPQFYETTIPVISLLYNYYNNSFSSFWLYNAENRRQHMEWYSGNGNLHPDPVVKNRWHYISYMPNEPLTVKFSSISLDRDLLNRIVNQASRWVYSQNSSMSDAVIPFFNGEPWTMMQCGEAISQDDISNMMLHSGQNFVSPELFSNARNWQPHAPWTYYMGMIDMANFYIQKIDLFKSESVEMRDQTKAVMRILRANSYLRLMQLFGPRWEDSNNGATPVAPLLTEWGNLDLPASSMADLRDFCKEDLEFAIAKLDGICRPGPIPTADVARGLLVRLSLLCHDWQTAATQSKILLDKYPLTTNDELKAGFFKPTESWIWTAPETDLDGDDYLYYYSFQSVAAVNGAYPLYWNTGCQIGSIDRDLFLSIPENDVRRSMFIMPENIGYGSSRFFNPNGVDANDMKLLNMSLRALAVVNKNKPEGVDMKIENLPNGSTPNFFFGSQFKFWGSKTGVYSSDDNVCLMRADEFLLARAEALCELGDEAGALDCLNRLNSMRNPDYAFQGTGSALRDEIRLSRRIELWGEGHSFFDFKRWNLPIVRRAWVADDTESGNWPEAAAGTFPASGYNGWRYLVPKQAVDANPNLDLSAYGYTAPAGYEDDPAPSAAPARDARVRDTKGRQVKTQPAETKQLKAKPAKTLSPVISVR